MAPRHQRTSTLPESDPPPSFDDDCSADTDQCTMRDVVRALGREIRVRFDRLEERIDEASRKAEEAQKTAKELHDADLVRSTSEKMAAKAAEELRDWFRWAIPLAITLMSLLVGVAVWAVTHAK